MKLGFVGGAVGAFALLFGGQSAMAEGNGVVQRTDPKANSPAGVIYQIPLDSGRRYAAPVLPVGSRPGGTDGHGGSGGSGADGSGSAASSSGGSDSHAAAAGTQSASAAAPDGGGTPSDPSSIHSENGFGSSSQVPGVSRAALQTGAGVPATSTPGSTLPTYLLIGLVALAAIGAGALTTGARRRRSEGAAERPTNT
jgi:hypothetical protein